MEKPLNVEEAARFLGLKKGTVYNLISRKAIPHYKVGRRVLFRHAKLETWFENKFVPCASLPREAGRKPQRTGVNVQQIIKNAVEQYSRR